MLGAILGLAIAALVLTRWLAQKPPQPAETAPTEVKRRYWQERLKKDISDKEAYLKLGIVEERAGFYFAARRNLEAARALGVSDALISGTLGRALTHLSEPELAVKELLKAVELAPGKWEPVANLAGFYVSNNVSSKANELLLGFWDKSDKAGLTPQELERLSLAFTECNNDTAAYAVAKALVEKVPDYTGGQILAARAALANGDPKTAKTFVEQALKATPDESAALYFYGLILNQLKDYDGALRVWQKANAINPSAPDIYERIGIEYARRGDFKRAVLALEKLAINTPEIGRSLELATAYRKLGDRENALYWEAVAAGLERNYALALKKAQEVAASRDPYKRRRGLSAVAEAYLGLGKKKEYAQTIFETTKAETVEDLILRLRAYEVLDKYPERLACLEKIIALDPKQEASVRYNRSEILEKIGRFDDAEKELERALELEPENTTYANDLATLYFARHSVGDRLNKATSLYEKVLLKVADEESVWLALGQCYAAKNQLVRAARCIEHAIDLDSGNGPAYLELGRIYARSGNTAGSQAMLKLYQKYVAFEQRRQTLQTRARRSDATADQILEYADLLLNMGSTVDALQQYEKAYALNTKDRALKNTLRILYRRLGLTEKLTNLENSGL